MGIGPIWGINSLTSLSSLVEIHQSINNRSPKTELLMNKSLQEYIIKICKSRVCCLSQKLKPEKVTSFLVFFRH